MIQINRVGVLGAGVMGATIAAHLANAGLEVLLLDIVPKELEAAEEKSGLSLESRQVRNRIATAGLQGLYRMKPAPLYLKEYGAKISVGNLEDDLDKLNGCDWVIEVVVEYMPIKLELLKKLVPHLRPDVIFSTNTSGLSVNEMAKVLPVEMRRNFLASHFFNPPRYMHLMEIVPCRETDPEVMDHLADFFSRRLGKGVVYAKDTTNFIANRIGTYAIFKGMVHMVEMEMTVEEVDAIAGPATGRPKSAAFRTADLVGLDTLAHVATNSHDLLPEDEERDVFKLPAFLKKMLAEKKLGNKTGQGFYKKEKEAGKKKIFYYDYNNGQYQPLANPRFTSILSVKQVDDPVRKIQMVLAGADKASEYAWRSLRDTLLYAFNRIPEIADDVVNIDNAMRWGFNWELGPFEMLDAITPAAFVKRAEKDGVAVPESLKGIESFYRYANGQKQFFDVLKREYIPVPSREGRIELEILKKAGKVVEKTVNCSLLDLGDGVFGLEFHSKMNAVTGDILSLTRKAVRRAEQEGLGLVVGNRGTNFSVGANLMMIAVALAEGAYEDIQMAVATFQKATMSLKYSRVPVVAAPFGMTLGGGCEYCLHSDAINAHAETYMGLVEVGVGLLPAAGGTKEMALRAIHQATTFKTDVQPFIFKYFEQLAMARVSMSADELYSMGYMRNGDSVTMDTADLITDAKKKVLALAANYRPKSPEINLPAPGRGGASAIKSQLWNMKMGNFITEYEEEMAGNIAEVICGGDVNPGTLITEEYLLQLELERFMTLCTRKKTIERIQHMLKTGKPLRN